MTGGSCNCGAVAFELATSPSDVFVCHCSICRKWSGTNGIAVVICDAADLTWLRGEDRIRSWKKPDADWESWFCDTCGSALPGKNDDKRVFVPAGLLPGDLPEMHVAHHIWVGSKAAWDEIGDAGKQHRRAFDDARI